MFFLTRCPDEDEDENEDNISKTHGYLGTLSDLGRVTYMVNGLSPRETGFPLRINANDQEFHICRDWFTLNLSSPIAFLTNF